jgi:integrase
MAVRGSPGGLFCISGLAQALHADKLEPSMPKRTRQRGSIRQRGDAYEVRVYAGLDPVTNKPIYLTGTADSSAEAEKLRTKLLGQVDANRQPKNKAKFIQLLDKYMEVRASELDESTQMRYADLIRLHIKPTFGEKKCSQLNAEMLELYYARLQICTEQCSGRRDGKNGHKCVPLAPATVRKIHFIIQPALAAGIRWEYVSVNVAEQVDPPSAPPSDVDPPSAEEAAAVLNKAWADDPDWATLIWLAMVVGCRRGELCGLQWEDIDFDAQIISVRFSEQQLRKRKSRRKDTKTHQKRRPSFDRDTKNLLLALRERAETRCATLGATLSKTAYLFSNAPDFSEPLVLTSVSRRYRKLAALLGLGAVKLSSLRHYNATELISAGVDLRTTAGRLGHGNGGATTLRVYAAWSPEADKRAASVVSKRLPMPGRQVDTLAMVVNGKHISCVCGNVTTWSALVAEDDYVQATCAGCGARVFGVDPASQVVESKTPEPAAAPPYKRVADWLRTQIADGVFKPGHMLPTVKELAAAHGVSVPTAHRGLALIHKEDLITVRRGARAVVRESERPPEADS